MSPRPGERLREDLPGRGDAIAGLPADGPVEVRWHATETFPWGGEKPSEHPTPRFRHLPDRSPDCFGVRRLRVGTDADNWTCVRGQSVRVGVRDSRTRGGGRSPWSLVVESARGHDRGRQFCRRVWSVRDVEPSGLKRFLERSPTRPGRLRRTPQRDHTEGAVSHCRHQFVCGRVVSRGHSEEPVSREVLALAESSCWRPDSEQFRSCRGGPESRPWSGHLVARTQTGASVSLTPPPAPRHRHRPPRRPPPATRSVCRPR